MRKDIQQWHTYIVRCQDGSLYTGITTSIERRIHEHNFSRRGAKYTRSRRPVVLVYSKQFNSRPEAQRYECFVKKLPRSDKLLLCGGHEIE